MGTTGDVLTERVAFFRDALSKSHAHADRMVSVLGSFDHRLSALNSAMRPIQVQTHAIQKAHDNINKTFKSVDLILDYFEHTREAELKLSRGPHDDLESYLSAINQLKGMLRVFSTIRA